VPSGAAASTGQGIALGFAAQFGEPGLRQSLNGGVLQHRGLLGCGN
jgi:hypothetical protein